ncbi:MAG: 2TM domain-containing protein [Anaerolineae bacterium]|nr:2TM domain-containing protein [Anaerolineae bacterium]
MMNAYSRDMAKAVAITIRKRRESFRRHLRTYLASTAAIFAVVLCQFANVLQAVVRENPLPMPNLDLAWFLIAAWLIWGTYLVLRGLYIYGGLGLRVRLRAQSLLDRQEKQIAHKLANDMFETATVEDGLLQVGSDGEIVIQQRGSNQNQAQ